MEKNNKEERWIEFEACRTVDEEENIPNFNLFGDPDPYETFPFTFKVNTTNTYENNKKRDIDADIDERDKGNNQNNGAAEAEETTREISITLKGYKHEHERIFDSTGLTLWRASKILCDYMCSNTKMIENKSVIELGAGLGLCGLLAHHLNASTVVMTDGDTDVLAEMRYNVDLNLNGASASRKEEEGSQIEASDEKVFCRQLRWGKSHIDKFKKSLTKSKQAPTTEVVDSAEEEEEDNFDIIIASDVIYVEYILDDLFETIVGLLSASKDARFVLAYARRAVDISLVFECAQKHGLSWTKPANEEGDDDGVEGVYIFSRIEGAQIIDKM